MVVSEVVKVATRRARLGDVDDLRAKPTKQTDCLMLPNQHALALRQNNPEIAKIVHDPRHSVHAAPT